MKITIDRAALLKPLGHVQSVVERRNTIPILSNVLLRASDGRLSMTATDMDMSIIESVACAIDQPGETTIAAQMIHEIVRKLPDGAEVELDTAGDSGQMTIRAGRSMFTLPTLPVDDFPTVSRDDLNVAFTLSATDAKMLIDRTRFAISTEETRYYLNGIYLHAGQNADVQVLRAVATDGHRLARVEMPLPAGAESMPSVIAPRKAVVELRKLIDEIDGDIDVSLSETKLCFKFADSVLTTKLIDGTFPDYERVIPTENDKILHVDCKTFSAAVDRVAIISTEKTRAIKMTIGNGALVLLANSPDAGSAREELEVDYKATPLEIGFNSRYLLDIAAQIDGGEAVFTLADAAAPTIIRDSADDSALYVLMPMRV
jgi:DNA polymerase-3 subunit beta